MVATHIPGYSYGTADVAISPVTLRDLEVLKRVTGFTEEDERYLRLAGELLADWTDELVSVWRGIINPANPSASMTSRRSRAFPQIIWCRFSSS